MLASTPQDCHFSRVQSACKVNVLAIPSLALRLSLMRFYLRKVLAREMGARSIILAPLPRLVGVGGLEQNRLELVVAQDLAVAVGARVSSVMFSVVVVRPDKEDVEEEGAESPEEDAGGGDCEEAAAGSVLLTVLLPGGLAIRGVPLAADERRRLACHLFGRVGAGEAR